MAATDASQPSDDSDDERDDVNVGASATRGGQMEPTRDFDGPSIYPDASAVNWMAIGLSESGNVPPTKLGKYTIHGQIGRGGMGIVLKGFDPDLQRTVAIKILGPHLSHSPTARRRFQREARAAAAISHPNVLTIHAVEEQNELPFLVMEFVDGQSLREFITSRGKLDSLETIRLSAQIAQGLAAAHAQGVIHRDVKPANVMLHDGVNRVRLMDFGLARATFDNAELTSHDHTVGTPAYMAPEQVHGDNIDARADLFSLGCVMYFMLTGLSPFHGRTHAEMVHKILDVTPRSLHELDPNVPPVLSELVDRLLKKRPDDRYQSALEAADVLRRLLEQINQTPSDQLASVLMDPARISMLSNRVAPRRGRSWLPVSAVVLVCGAVAWWVWKDGLLGKNTEPATANGTAGSNANLPTTDSAESQAPVEKLTEITVGTGPEARCATIREAIKLAAPDCTITVLGPGPYAESVDVHGPELRGLRLIAKERVVWRGASGVIGESHILSIRDVSDVAISGFDFESLGGSERAVVFSGQADNLTFTDCRMSHLGEIQRLALCWVGSFAQETPGRVRFQRCQFQALRGFCLSIDARDRPAPYIECEDCDFTGQATLLYANATCHRLRVARSVFRGGGNGINLSLQNWWPDSRIEIVNNTFVGTRYWLGFMESFSEGSRPQGQTDSRVCNNLILGGERVQGGVEREEIALNSWTFSCNWWESDGTTKSTATHDGRIATLYPRLNFPVREDRLDPGYLVPAAGSPLLTSGCGGDLPSYIGAKDRKP